MAIGRQRHIDDAGTEPRRVLRREAEIRDRGRTIALRENIRTGQEIAQYAAPLFALEFDKTRQLAAAGIDGEPWNRRQIGTGNQEYIGAMDGECAARDGTGNHPR